MPHLRRLAIALFVLLSLAALPVHLSTTAAQELQNTPSTVLSDSPISGFELRTVSGGLGTPTKSIHWWWTFGRDDCNGEFPNSAQIKIVPSLGTAQRTLEPTTCRLLDAPASNVVRDGQFVYFFADSKIRRKAIGAAADDPSQVMTRVTVPANNELLPSLALDGSGQLYYATYDSSVSTIFKLPADNSANPVALVSIGAKISQIEPARFSAIPGPADGGIVLTNNGVLLRWHPANSTPLRTLASNISTFAVHSYNFSSGGSLARSVTVFAGQSEKLLKINAATGNQSTIFTATGDNRITSIATDSDGAPANRKIYLSETSYVFNPFPAAVDTSIHRAPMSADATSDWDLILAEGGGTNLRSDDQKLYFLNNKNLGSGSAILSLPTDAPAIQIDIEAVDLEATQAIQSFDPAFPLIENHPTYVRAYARIVTDSTAKNSYSVTGQLSGTLNGESLGTLQAEKTFEVVPESTRSLADTRRDATLTFLFELPDDWVENGFDPPLPGVLNLTFSVNLNGDPPETTLANNSVSRTLTTFQRYRPCLMFVPVRTEAPLPSYNIPNWSTVMARTLSYFPFGSFRTYLPWNSTDLEGNYILSDDEEPYDFSEQGGDGDALDDLDLLQFFADIPESCENDWHFVGIIHPKTNWTFKNNDDQSVTRGGLGRNPGHVVLAKIGFVPPQDGEDGKTVGAGTLAHELGHNYGRSHVACGDFPSNETSFSFTIYDPCNLYFDFPLENENAQMGFDPLNQRAIDPIGTSEIMSYSSPKWVSHDFWQYMLTELETQQQQVQARIQAEPAAEGPVLLLSGRIIPDASPADLQSAGPYLCALGPSGETGRFNTLYSLPARFAPEAQVRRSNALRAAHVARLAAQPDPLSYTLRLRAADGSLLSETPLATTQLTEHDTGQHQLSFAEYVPYDPLTRKIQLVVSDTVVVEQPVSANAPTVSITNLALDAGQSKVTLSWQADDADGDALEATVQYSADNGASWRALLTGHTGTTASFDTTGLPGGAQALLRVIVSDGVNTANATSTPFAVAKHAPTPLIDGIEPEQRIAYGASITVNGIAFDAEEGSLEPDALVWKLTGPTLASGGGEQIRLANLAPGSYTLKLTATDEDGQSAAIERNFSVLPLQVPDGAAPVVDGYCADGAYAAAAQVALPGSNPAQLHLLHAGDTLYACFSGLRENSGIGKNHAGLRIDANSSGGTQTAVGDIGFYINEDGLPTLLQNSGGQLLKSQNPPSGFEALIGATANGRWSAEFAIHEDLVGGWNHTARLAAVYNVVNTAADTAIWPRSAAANEPDSWAAVNFGAGLIQINRAPVADAGPDRSVAPRGVERVYLDGSASYDADRNNLSYSWTQSGGPAVQISEAEQAVMHFTVSPVSASTTYRFQLVVSDGQADSAASEVVVTVLPPRSQMSSALGDALYLPLVRR